MTDTKRLVMTVIDIVSPVDINAKEWTFLRELRSAELGPVVVGVLVDEETSRIASHDEHRVKLFVSNEQQTALQEVQVVFLLPLIQI